jgi:hypothetical protein
MKIANNLMFCSSNVNLNRQDMSTPEQWSTRVRIANVGLHPPYYVTTVAHSDKATRAVHQRRIQQRDQRCEMRVMTVMRRRRQKQQSI